MAELSWSRRARADLFAIVDYISDDSPDAALMVLETIEDRVATLVEYPRQGRTGRVTGTRELFVPPNYVVVYSDTPERLTILRVLHAAQMWP